jgi:aspartate aminotransferase
MGAFASPFRKFLPLADQAKARGTEVIHLNIGQPDFLMPEAAMSELRGHNYAYIPYGAAEGQMKIRKTWAKYYEKFDIYIDAEDILISTGASEGILFTLLSIADPGDEIIVPEPFYANYNGFCQMANVNIVPLFTSIDDGFPIPDIEVFEQAISPKTKAILVSNPNNPSGKIYSPQQLQSLLDLAIKYNLFLMVDEAYSEFVYDGFDFRSALTFSKGVQNVIVIDSVSKRFNACGVRVGAIASRNRPLLEQITKYARLRLSPPMLGQSFANEALSLPSTYHEALLADFENRRSTVLRRLEAMPAVEYHRPEGAFYIFVRLPIDDSDAFCAWLLTDFSKNGQTVMLSPGTGFYATPGKGVDEVRIAYMVEEDAINKGMDCLEAALSVYPGITSVPLSVTV